MFVPISFDNVSYFRNEFRGDLIVTQGVLYFFPHTNLSAEKPKRSYHPPANLALFLGPAGDIMNLGIGVIDKLFDLWDWFARGTINQTRLKEKGLWPPAPANLESRATQQQLDKFIKEAQKEPGPLVSYQYSLPKPMRFSTAQIKNLRIRAGTLRFDSEFDSHDFAIGFRRRRRLREALRSAEFTTLQNRER
jgi:hypothetical protein